jgi:hypothetical protein
MRRAISGDGGAVERTAGAGGAAPTSTAGEEDPGEAGPVMVLDPAPVGHPFSHLKPVYRYPFHSISKQNILSLKLLFLSLSFSRDFLIIFVMSRYLFCFLNFPFLRNTVSSTLRVL